jgi:hypothetical protein
MSKKNSLKLNENRKFFPDHVFGKNAINFLKKFIIFYYDICWGMGINITPGIHTRLTRV